ncbi:MAG: PAS domain S-box protein, partial [Chloroflexi bacterium]|nr:PAS domain S-box protein [Chloroflexota bacterium]
MKDEKKSKTQLIEELNQLRSQISEMDTAAPERKQAEEALRESEEKYRSLVENAGIPIMNYSLDGCLLFINSIGAKNLGGKPEDLIGTFITEYLPDMASEAMSRIRGVGEDGVKREFEDCVELPSGDKCWFSTNFYAVNDANGTVVAVQMVSRDITERKQAEDALRESEMRFRITAEETGQLVYSFDPKTGKVKWAGAIEAVTGYTHEEYQLFDTDAWAEQIHPDDREMVLKNMENAMEHQTNFEAEYRFRRKDGSYIFVEERGAFVPGGENAPYPTVGTISDITDRKQAEKALHASETRLRSFLDNFPGVAFISYPGKCALYSNKALADVYGLT